MDLIICFILLGALLIGILASLWIDDDIASVLSYVFSLIVGIALIYSYTVNDNKEIDNYDTISGVVYDVIDYQIDTNIFINDTDTLKTYTITYYTE